MLNGTAAAIQKELDYFAPDQLRLHKYMALWNAPIHLFIPLPGGITRSMSARMAEFARKPRPGRPLSEDFRARIQICSVPAPSLSSGREFDVPWYFTQLSRLENPGRIKLERGARTMPDMLDWESHVIQSHLLKQSSPHADEDTSLLSFRNSVSQYRTCSPVKLLFRRNAAHFAATESDQRLS